MQCSALKFCLIFHVFNCLKRILESLFPSSTPHRSELSISFNSKHQNNCLSCPIQLSAKLIISQTQNLPFPLIPKKTPKIKSNSFTYIPSLKSAFIQVISSLTDHIFFRLTRREPSPELVGLATRLSVV